MNKLLAILALLFCISALADHVPGHAKLEWGIGAVILTAPDYIGSELTQHIIAPFPYLKYRGKYLRIDDGVEALLFNTPDLLLSISGNGSLPPPDDNPTRKGMEKLDASVEFGPSLEYRLNHDETTSVWLEIPLRFAFSIGHNTAYIGNIFNPKIAWRKPAKDKFDWKLRVAVGPLFADQKFNGHYYNVTTQDATVQRPIFTTSKGYTGFRTDFTYSRRIGKYWIGGFIRNDNIKNSVIDDSPLVSVNHNWTAGIALARVISDH